MNQEERSAYEQSLGYQTERIRQQTIAVIDGLPRPLRWLARFYMRRVLKAGSR